MEKLREAIRNLERQAEKYERHLGAERFPSPPEEYFDKLAQAVDLVTAELAIPEVKPAVAEVKPEEPKPVDSVPVVSPEEQKARDAKQAAEMAENTRRAASQE